MNTTAQVIEKLSDAARVLVRDANTNGSGIVTGCGDAFREACIAGYLLPVRGAIHKWRITVKGREYCLKLMRAH
ncbi:MULTISPECIES: hypothetical protein [unclassified Shinella]|uniref:hypothetical protein n=1 Tax=unclassified Shinella TaxID=2643062 RepID=UPI00234E6FE5|nr:MULTISPECIES: hypothetical protein [unclassified Shinella]MCO5153361.1 hypothetical protein [Shinella sp.]MDC7260540.1 hypothetical protein [Shinella sp. HY16]MDC7267435.1 hypothetical protein [Shinella sp. YZ44]